MLNDDALMQKIMQGLHRNSSAYLYLFVAENRLRYFVFNSLEEQFAPHNGKGWMSQALDASVLDKIEKRKSLHFKKSSYIEIVDEHPFSFLEMAELKQIILSHWKLFSDVFQDQIQFESLFDVVRVARNAIAHNRSISQELHDDLKEQCLRLIALMMGKSLSKSGMLELDPIEEVFSARFLDVVKIFRNRNEFDSEISYKELFKEAKSIDAMGLSLNAITVNYGSQHLDELLDDGCKIRLLFLKPFSKGMKAREEEEGFSGDELSNLTKNNLHFIKKYSESVDAAHQSDLQYKVYSSPVRINLFVINGNVMVVQYYDPGGRGIDMPCLLIKKRDIKNGLFPYFEKVFTNAWNRGEAYEDKKSFAFWGRK